MAGDILAGLAEALASGSVEVVDLAQPLEPATPVIALPPQFGQSAPFRMERISDYDDRGPAWAWSNLSLGEHTGTHFDAPVHWITGKDLPGNALDTIPARRLVAPANVIDCTAACEADADFLLTPAGIEAWEAQHGKIEPGSWVLLRSGWSPLPDVGDTGSAVGKAMVATDPEGPAAFMVTDITMDPSAGEIATGRVFSGRLQKGMELSVVGTKTKNRIQHVSLFMGPERLMVDEVSAGNIAAVIGLSDAFAGTTMAADATMAPFEEIRHVSEPVVTVAIEPKRMADLPKLIEVMRKIAKEDASLRVEINQETGEHLLSGMGELHLEITQYRIVNDYKVEISASTPIVVYRELVRHPGGPFEGKSPNKHNKFYFEVEPLPAAVVQAIKDGEIAQGKSFKDLKTLVTRMDQLGISRDEGRGLTAVEGTNALFDVTKGIQYLNETMDLIVDAFKEAMNRGPLANEKVYGLKVRLVDAKLHEDSIHRGPAQTIPAARSGIYGAMVLGDRLLLEPFQKVIVNVPQEVLAGSTRELQRRRGEILDMTSVGDLQTVSAKVPVAELFGFASDIRSATAGKVLWSTESLGFEPVPVELQPKVVGEIRQRRGLKPEPYDAAYYSG